MHAQSGGHRPVGVIFLSERRPEHRHHRVADELHDRSALPRMASFMAARWMFSCPASWLGSACSAMVEYDRISLMSTVTVDAFGLADVPPIMAKLLRQPAGKQAGQGLPLLFPIHDGLVEKAEALERALGSRRHPLGQFDEHRLHLGVDGRGGRWRATAMALIGLPSATMLERASSAGVSPPWVVTGRSNASTMEGSSAVPPVATARMASTSWLPSAMWSLRRYP